jgi:hypothetical protein
LLFYASLEYKQRFWLSGHESLQDGPEKQYLLPPSWLLLHFIIVTLSLYDHTHSIRHAAVLEIYLFLTLLFDIVRTRTLWLITADHTAAVVFISSVVLKAVVLGLEAYGERGSWINPEDYLRNREETSGVFG